MHLQISGKGVEKPNYIYSHRHTKCGNGVSDSLPRLRILAIRFVLSFLTEAIFHCPIHLPG